MREGQNINSSLSVLGQAAGKTFEDQAQIPRGWGFSVLAQKSALALWLLPADSVLDSDVFDVNVIVILVLQ